MTGREEWCVKRDLVLYGVLKFHSTSLLETLDPNISSALLIQSGYNAEICGIGVPEADYHVRLFAAMVAQHLWERLIQGRWRCRHHTKIEAVLGNPERWNDEDWWLERRLHSWPAAKSWPGTVSKARPLGPNATVVALPRALHPSPASDIHATVARASLVVSRSKPRKLTVESHRAAETEPLNLFTRAASSVTDVPHDVSIAPWSRRQIHRASVSSWRLKLLELE